jgi:hypothetical protein
MNDLDLKGMEADLQRLKPAATPPPLMARLLAAVDAPARSPIPQPGREASLWESWRRLWRWLVPVAAVGVLILAVTRSMTPPKPAVVPAANLPPLKADDVQLARQLVGTYDAIAELPGGETVRFRCHEWTDETTWRDTARGLEFVQSQPSFEVIPVRFETY